MIKCIHTVAMANAPSAQSAEQHANNESCHFIPI